MKSQDILLLLKLVSLWQSQAGSQHHVLGTSDSTALMAAHQERHVYQNGIQFSVRALAESTGVSKSQVSLSLQRCQDLGLTTIDRFSGLPRANVQALGEFIVYGIRYVFPAKPGEITRGIATGLAAPVLQGKMMTAGEFVPVWPDARGDTKGQAVAPLFKSVPQVIETDPHLYALLALTDAIRIGQARERNYAADKLIALLQ